MILDLFKLDGKVALVTGANTGLGQKMCVALAEAGAKVVGVARRSCDETKALIKDGFFKEVIADLSLIEHGEKIIKDSIECFGQIDILVNNAGVIKREDAINVKIEDFDSVLKLNVEMPFLLSKLCARHFLARGVGGKIINIASMLSYQGGVRVVSYTASKHAILGITKALANEWSKYNINVNAIAPGYMATNNTKALRDDETRSQEILNRIPAGRWGLNDDMMGAVVFLASDASSYLNGETVNVDGGWMCR